MSVYDDDFLIPKKRVAQRLGKSVSGLNAYIRRNPEFPKAIKQGRHRQSSVFYSNAAITAWICRVIQEAE